MLLPHAESIVVAGLPAEVLNSVHGPLALLAATLGRWDEAEAHHAADEAANLRMGNRLWLITEPVGVGAGRSPPAAGDGDADRARELLESCATEARDAGMTRIEGLANDLAATLT